MGRLWEKYNRGEDFVNLAKIRSINRTTAYSIVLRDEDAAAHGRKWYQKFDEDMRDYLVECLEWNPLLTLRQLNAERQDHFPAKPWFSDKTL